MNNNNKMQCKITRGSTRAALRTGLWISSNWQKANRKLFYSTSLFSSIKERILGFSENQDTPFHWKEFPLRIYSWVGQISREESIHYNACAIWYAIIFGKIIIPRPATTYYPTHYPNGIVGIL